MIYSNPAKEKYQKRQPIMTGMLRFANPALAEIMVRAGIEQITIDNEHYPFTDDEITNLARVIRGLGAECVVRLGTKNHEAIYRVMDMGVNGVLLPNVETAEEAQMIVDSVKYPPVGKRGCCPITRGADYGVELDVQEYYRKINDVTTVGIMIESKKGYENLDAIMDVKGIDYFIIGPSDFSGSFGKPGQAKTDPEIQAAMKDAFARMIAHGYTVGDIAYTPELARTNIREGRTFLNIGSDLQMVSRLFKEHVEGAESEIEKAGMKSRHTDPVAKLRAGDPVITPFLRIAEPGIAEIISSYNVDFVLVDDEHFPFTDRDLIDCIRAIHGKGKKALVRPHDKSKPSVGRILDMGADGILFPQVDSAEEARALVSYTKYAPEGIRGLCPITAGADYGYGHSAQEYTKMANSRIVVGVQIETKDAVEDLDNILKVEGIDFLGVGPSDLSNSYGLPGQYDDPRLVEIIEGVNRRCVEAGIGLFGMPYTTPDVGKFLKKGFNVLNIGSDVQYMIWGFNKLIADIRKVIEEETR